MTDDLLSTRPRPIFIHGGGRQAMLDSEAEPKNLIRWALKNSGSSPAAQNDN
jgi:hypothetical protein